MSILAGLFGKDKNKEAVHQPIISNDITGCFTSHFIRINDLLRGQEFSEVPVGEELCAMMMAALEYTAASRYIHIDGQRDEIINWFLAPSAGSSGKKFDKLSREFGKRLEIYRSREKEGDIRGDFLLRNISDEEKTYPPFRYGVIFCDRMYNTGCLVDYDKAPALPERNRDKEEFFMAILEKLMEYEQELKKFFE